MNFMGKISTGALVFMLSLGSLHAESDFAKIYTECGLGGIIGSAIEDPTTSKVMAAITNVTWDLGTTASTSYYSSNNTCANKKVRVAAFINQSYEKLENDIASGNGKYFDTLADLVAGQQNKNQFKTMVRAKFAKAVQSKDFASLSRKEKVEKLYNIVFS